MKDTSKYFTLVVLFFIFLLHNTKSGEHNNRLFQNELGDDATTDCTIHQLRRLTQNNAISCKPVFGNLRVCETRVDNNPERYVCSGGSWEIYTGTDIGDHTRQKRFLIAGALTWSALFGFLAGGGGNFLTTVLCIFTSGNKECKRQEVSVSELKAPTYDGCPPNDIQDVYTAASGKTDVVVRWTVPTAKDEGFIVSDEQTCCSYKRGERFPGLPDEGQEHAITYTAKDNHGLTTTCTFYFVVKYNTCEEPEIPQNGRKVDCPKGYISGGTCLFECDAGYAIDGSSKATCNDDQTWEQIPTCTKLTCLAPFELSNGQVICEDPNHSYDTDCDFVCDEGFILNGRRKMTCQADQTWSVDLSQIACEDDEPPVISCQSPQVFYADRGMFSTQVVWYAPRATDNVDENPTIRQLEGPSSGDTLSEGFHYALYRATDSNGNSLPAISECTVTIEVKVVKCSSGPADALNNSRFLLYNCSDTSFYNGVTCTLGCDLNLPLNGTNLMSCERNGTSGNGVWSWGSGSQPFCKVVECPTLDPPKHGSFTTDTVNSRPLHVMLCQNGYDVSSVGAHFTGRMSCQDSGEWYPINAFPDCIVPVFPWLNLPTELYYEGNCNDEDTKNRIKNHILKYLQDVEADIDNSICPDADTCKCDNVVVVCGSTRRKRESKHHVKKRQSSYALVTWDIKAVFNQGNRTTNEVYLEVFNWTKKIADKIETDVNNGSLDLAGFTLSSGAFQTADQPSLECDDGYKRETGSVVCKPCPAGTYLNETTGNCEFCNIGEYMETEGARACDLCPEGYSTLTTGSKLQNKCIKLCGPGFFSTTTMEPCSACPVGTYQANNGSTACQSCQYGLTTNSTNRTSIDQCQSFDLVVGEIALRQNVGAFTASSASSFTLSLWMKLGSADSGEFDLYITDYVGNVMTLKISDTVAAIVGSTEVSTDVNLTSSYWTHIIVNEDFSARTLQVYIDEQLKVDETDVQIDSSKTVSSATVDMQSTFSDVYASGFVLYGRALGSAEITTLSQSCSVSQSDEIFAMVDILNSGLEGIAATTPTLCDPIDECGTAPCGTHKCVNEVGGFQCICYGGMSGTYCEIPPDYCEDNECVEGECVPGNATYTCSCNNGYTGNFCDKPPVDGEWSDWAEWSGCNASCGGGTRSRTRACNNPPAGYLGNDCPGESQGSEACNEIECPECPVLRRKFGTSLSCLDISTSGLRECTMTCIQGKALPNGQKAFEKYYCGEGTNYTWVPIDKTPTCVDLAPPDIIGAATSVSYPTSILSSQEEAFKSSVEANLANVGCVQSGRCTVAASTDSLESRRRRATSSIVTLQFSIQFTQTGDLAMTEYLTTGTESAAMAELIEALTALTEIITYIENNTASVFDVTVDGVTYTLTNTSTSSVLTVSCADGYAGAGGLCGVCAAGTKLEDLHCIDCDVGTYQPDAGQTFCHECPEGWTTETYGATNVSECNVPSQTSGSGNNDDSVVIIVVVVVCVVAVLVAVGVIALVLWKKAKRRTFRENFRQGSTASFTMVGPAQSRDSLIDDQMNTKFDLNLLGTELTRTSFAST